MLGFDPFVLSWVLRHRARIRSLQFVSGYRTSHPDSIPSFCFGFSDIAPGFDPFVLFRVLRHRTRIRSLRFVSGSLILRSDSTLHFVLGSPTSLPDSIPSFCFRFFCLTPGFNPFVLFWVLRHRVRIRSFYFLFFYFGFSNIVPGLDPFLLLLSSLASCPDSIPFFCFRFSDIVPGFDPFLFRVLRHCAQILLSFPASCPNFRHLPRHRVRASLIFFGIASDFHYLFWHRIRISLSFSASCPDFPYLLRHCVRASLIFFGIEPYFHYLFWHRVRIFLIFLGIMSKHRLSSSASSPAFIIFSGIVFEFSSSSSASCPNIAYLFRHHIRLSPISTGIVSGSLIFPGIVLGFLLVL